MGLDGLLHDGQAQAGALLVLPPGGVCLVEALPDLVQGVPGDADAVVLDRDVDLVAPVRGLHRDAGVGVAELDGIVDQVVEDLLDLFPVRVHVQVAGGQNELNGNLPLCADALKGGGRVLDDLVYVENLLVQENVLCVKLVQRQQILGQVRQPLCLKEDDVQVFLLHFRRDGPVCHGLHIALDGGERGAEIVGYICHELFLVVLHVPQLRGHIVQGGGQIPHLVLGGHRDLVLQVAGGVLGGSLRDPAQRPVHEKLEGQQHDKGQKINDDHRGVDRAHQGVPEIRQVGHLLVDDQVAPGGKALDYRCADREYILLKIAVIVSFLVGGASAGGRVKIPYPRRGGGITVGAGRDQHIALPVDQPDSGVRVGGDAVQLHLYLRACEQVAEVARQIVICHGGGLGVEPVRLRGFKAAVGQPRGQSGGGKKAQEPEDDIDEDEFQVQCAVQGERIFFRFFSSEEHYFTSNLYPMPHTVARDQEGWSLIFSRRRLMCTSTVRVSPIYSYPHIWSRSCSLVKT